MKTALRIMIAAAVATMFAAGGLAGSAAAQEEVEIIDQDISDDDLVDADANVGNPTTATAVNAGNVGSGTQSATAVADAENSAGDEFEQEAYLD